MSDDGRCNRCGQCCHFMDGDKLRKCRFLLKTSDNKFWCRIYANRIGTHIGTLHDGTRLYCNNIENAPNDFADCPYNTGKRPQVDFRPLMLHNIPKNQKARGEAPHA